MSKSSCTASPSSNRCRPLLLSQTTRTNPAAPSSSASIRTRSLPTTVQSTLSGFGALRRTSPSLLTARPTTPQVGHVKETTGTAHGRACSWRPLGNLWAIHRCPCAQHHQTSGGQMPQPPCTSHLSRDLPPPSNISQQGKLRRLYPQLRMCRVRHDYEKTRRKRRKPVAAKLLNTHISKRRRKPLRVLRRAPQSSPQKIRYPTRYVRSLSTPSFQQRSTECRAQCRCLNQAQRVEAQEQEARLNPYGKTYKDRRNALSVACPNRQ